MDIPQVEKSLICTKIINTIDFTMIVTAKISSTGWGELVVYSGVVPQLLRFFTSVLWCFFFDFLCALDYSSKRKSSQN